MAFPTGYSKYQEITIDHTKVGADLTDYEVYINLADLLKAGADIFDTCRTDGGDIRATKSDGTTELAIQVVAIDTTAKTGEVHVKFSGTLSSSSDTIIRIYYNGTDTGYAATDTYGRNAVWSGCRAVYHMQSVDDNTSNAYTLTNTGTVTFATGGLLTNRSSIPSGTNKMLNRTDNVGVTATGSWSFTTWIRMASETTTDREILQQYVVGASGAIYRGLYEYNSGSRRVRFFRIGSGAVFLDKSGNIANDTWRHIVFTYNGSTEKLYVDNAAAVTGSASGTTSVGAAEFNLGGGSTNTSLNGLMALTKVRTVELASTWISTEYNNQNSPATFYAIGSEVGGSTVISPSAQVATFSTPARTIIRGVVLQAATQVGTFSLPGDTVLTSVRVSPIAQTATFTIPAFGISASAVVFNATAQVSTFTVPAYTVLRGSVFSPDAQTLTFTVPSLVVATGNTVSAQPIVLTFTIPALAFLGALWRRSARSSANWTRSSINND